MVRDICHASKHADLTWTEARASTHAPILTTLVYEPAKARGGQQHHSIWVVTNEQARHNLVDELQHAISEWRQFLDGKCV